MKDETVFSLMRDFRNSRCYGLYVGRVDSNKFLEYSPPPVTERVPFSTDAVPTFNLDKSELQGLFDELYKNGFRPSDSVSAAKQELAMQEHLDDMRKIAGKFLKIELGDK